MREISPRLALEFNEHRCTATMFYVAAVLV
jgi:hypothetical protein